MKVQVTHDRTILQITWFPNGDPWNVWTVTKTLDAETTKVLDAVASISSPQLCTAKAMRKHARQLELATRIAEQLDRAIGTWNAAKVLAEEIDILPTPYAKWPYQDPVIVTRNRATKRVEVKYADYSN